MIVAKDLSFPFSFSLVGVHMYKTSISQVPIESVQMEGVSKTNIQWLLNKPRTPNFAMRRYQMEKGGTIPLHSHSWEHEMYVLSGTGLALEDGKEPLPVKVGDVLYIEPYELHGWEQTGDEVFTFLCVIPHPKE